MGTGNPFLQVFDCIGLGVYPRGHGESAALKGNPAARGGLSPWARGIRRAAGGKHDARRSIPVGTGNPAPEAGRPRISGVYPRGHGESTSVMTVAASGSGLSPWARGILCVKMTHL